MVAYTSFTSMALLALAGLGSCGIIEQLQQSPDGWTLLEKDVDPEQPLRLSFALREPSIDEIRNTLDDPSAPHLTREQALELRAPDQADVEAVNGWLNKNGIADGVRENDWVHVHTTVGKAESLLDMKMHRYDFEGKGAVLRTTAYSVPDELEDAVSFVHPIANFMAPKKELSTITKARSVVSRANPCAQMTTPDCIRRMYNMPQPAAANATTKPSNGVRLGVAGFLEEYANYHDVSTFVSRFSPGTKSKSSFAVELVHGGQNIQSPAQAGAEAALDVQYTMALGYPADVTYYSTGGRGAQLNDSGGATPEEFVDNEPYLELLEHLLAKPDDELPHVLSFSYADNELSVPKPYAERVCSMFGLLASRGTTVVAGSGDGGAAGSRNSTCVRYDGSPVAMAVFPASCPWVTAVGAVSNINNPPTGAEFSGGGFSQYFKRETWQDSSVSSYETALGGRLRGLYNSSMRALPDISAVGTDFQIVLAQQVVSIAGTSASTPVLAAIVALIDEARFEAGKKPLGWLNGRLYRPEIAETLQDVKGGVSQSCTIAGIGMPGGWPAAQGWDAITGLGVPNNYAKFMQALVDQD
ncbi:tripeptidyl-peptidase I [Geosmithia morbida]|uniref:tripeptidyl-peptidase II n=1 Tax=Geosmithia morbida TaxID=1094350 RepID=A0A9P4Z148_9HYPO|nr:tripeptidyl-peptidase I [Geosmithia morbida]KAF4125497.1 tripeptidyl-peptidase I [Geosmithia morbida]